MRSSGHRVRRCGTSTARRTKGCARTIFRASATRSEQTRQNVYKAYRGKRAIAPVWWILPSCCCAPHELWLNKPHILQHYRERFTNIPVDEFRDTNNIQYAWIRLLGR